MDLEKILNSKEYKQLQHQLELMESKFKQEMNEIEEVIFENYIEKTADISEN